MARWPIPFQLYFDFSGYSDMAIGLAMMMGVRLPLNFDSPYKAPNIIEFWRRWHMTLSRFLRDYLYFALGGNRHGATRRYINLFLTMFLGGLWHGAGWTFVAWGTLHGCYLMVNHAWHALKRHAVHTSNRVSLLEAASARGITFFAVVIGWVFFRADSLAAACRMLEAMAHFSGLSLSDSYSQVIAQSKLAQWLELVGVVLPSPVLLSITLLSLYAVVTWWPNTQEVLAREYRQLDVVTASAPAPSRIAWRPNRVWLGALFAVSMMAVLGLSNVSEFLYFQF